jgi:hypothetical protein
VEVGYPDGSIVVVICDEAGRLCVRAMPVEGNSGETLAERQLSAIVKGVTEGDGAQTVSSGCIPASVIARSDTKIGEGSQRR